MTCSYLTPEAANVEEAAGRYLDALGCWREVAPRTAREGWMPVSLSFTPEPLHGPVADEDEPGEEDPDEDEDDEDEDEPRPKARKAASISWADFEQQQHDRHLREAASDFYEPAYDDSDDSDDVDLDDPDEAPDYTRKWLSIIPVRMDLAYDEPGEPREVYRLDYGRVFERELRGLLTAMACVNDKTEEKRLVAISNRSKKYKRELRKWIGTVDKASPVFTLVRRYGASFLVEEHMLRDIWESEAGENFSYFRDLSKSTSPEAKKLAQQRAAKQYRNPSKKAAKLAAQKAKRVQASCEQKVREAERKRAKRAGMTPEQKAAHKAKEAERLRAHRAQRKS